MGSSHRFQLGTTSCEGEWGMKGLRLAARASAEVFTTPHPRPCQLLEERTIVGRSATPSGRRQQKL